MARKLFRWFGLLLAIPLLLPAALISHATTAQAYLSCQYWTGNIADSVSATAPGLVGVSFSSYVRYTECLDTNLSPTLINVNYFSEAVSYTGGPYHASVQFGVCGWSSPYSHTCGSSVGYTFAVSGACSGQCTSWRGGYVNYTIPYNTSAATFERWQGCLSSPYGGENYCDSFNQFVARRGYLFSVGYGA